MTPTATRSAIVAEARSWLLTPWHHNARVKGAGVDCAQLLVAVYTAVGLIPPLTIPPYARDWHLHNDEPLFLNRVLQYADPIPGPPLPGDVVMFRYGRHAAHGGIVVDWPLIIHAWLDERLVILSDVLTSPLRSRVAGFYRVRGVA